MQTAKIRRLISKTIADDNRTKNAENILRTALRQRGLTFNKSQIKGLVQFMRAYIENVPLLLEKVAKGAKEKGLANQVMPMLNAVAQYFLEPHDFIPDHLGLIGLLDDAYLAQKLVQVMSDTFRQQTGKPLLDTDLSEGNNMIRNLIGEPVASMLDASVMNTIQVPNLQQLFQNLMNFQNMMPMPAPHPLYGNVSAREIADIRLGAMGVI